jgi:hypothetical protein
MNAFWILYVRKRYKERPQKITVFSEMLVAVMSQVWDMRGDRQLVVSSTQSD